MSYTQPVIPLLILVLLAALLSRKTGRVKLWVGAAAVLLLLSWAPVSRLLSATLERGYPVRTYPVGDAEAIVVLSGGIYPQSPTEPEDLLRSDGYLRTRYAGWLYRNWRALPIVVSGGDSGIPDHPVISAEVMRQALIEQGVPPGMIWTEGRSTSTYENALYSAELLRAHGIGRIALVTQAYHMPRSEKVFRRQGLAVVPAPCAYRSIRFHKLSLADLFPNPRKLEESEDVIHEWVGLVWYKLSGKI